MMCDIAPTNINILKGEADESDEESKCAMKDEEDLHSREVSSNLFKSGLLVEGEAPESDCEEIDEQGDTHLKTQEKSNTLQELSKEQQQFQEGRPSGQSLLEDKLREKNNMLMTQVETFTKSIFLSTAKDFQTLLVQMLKSKSTLQDASHSLRMVTNDLFHLEDKLDIVITCKILSDMKLPVV